MSISVKRRLAIECLVRLPRRASEGRSQAIDTKNGTKLRVGRASSGPGAAAASHRHLREEL
jgi:hypothetical protein